MAEKKERIAVILDFITRGGGKAQKTLARLEKQYTTAASTTQRIMAENDRRRLKTITTGETTQKRQTAYRKQRDIAERAGAGLMQAEGLHAMGMGPRPDALREAHMRETALEVERKDAFDRARLTKSVAASSAAATKARLKDSTVRQEVVGREQVSMMGFNSVMGLSFERWQDANKAGVKFNTMQGRLANRLRKSAHGMRGFKMELLSVMFFGMAVQRLFMGLLQPALQVSGVFEIWGAMLQVLFLPVALALLDWMLKMFEWVGNLSERSQMMINVFVVLGVIIGTILSVVGTFGLGIGGLIITFGGLIPVILAAVAIIGVLYAVWKANFLGIRENIEGVFEAIKNIVTGVLMVITGLIQMMSAIWRGDFEAFKGGATKVIEGLVKIVVNLFFNLSKNIRDIVIKITVFLGTIFSRIANNIGDIIRKLVYSIGDWFLKGFKILGEWLAGNSNPVVKGVGNMIILIEEKIRGLVAFITEKIEAAMNIVNNLKTAAVGAISKVPIIGGIVAPKKMARGGIVTSPTLAMIGERGPEAVIPLGKAGGMGGAGNKIIYITVSPTINITEEIKSDVDMKRIKDELSEDWVRDIESRVRSA